MQPGTQLGHYEILEAIGKGGMGEVWRAKDTKLGREVAIKTLPPEFAQDADRLARFEREAKLLASLNHSNIAAIYGLEEHEGSRFLVLELVEGDTLADRLKHGPVAVEESLKLALQIAEALEAAHEKGVIHRDLKPANIKVTADGIVKVLDFGLAKVFEPDDGELADAPTQTAIATRVGTVLGTPAYMSPEQARGDRVDGRADIWAFGVVLCEMLTGRSPFRRASPAESFAKLLESGPVNPQLPSTTPKAVRRLTERCLEKNLRDRLRHIGDGRIELQDQLRAPVQEHVALSAHAVGGMRYRWLGMGIAGIGLGLLSGWLVGTRSGGNAPLQPSHLNVTPVGTLQDQSLALSTTVAVSPDGRYIAYETAEDALIIRSLDTGDSISLGEGAAPFFSPDGASVAYFAGTSASLVSAPVDGGNPTPLASFPTRSRGGSWAGDGTIVFANNDGLFRVSEDGGETEPLIVPEPADGELWFAWPDVLPGDRSTVFTIIPADPSISPQIALLDLETLDYEVVGRGIRARYVQTGHLIIANQDNFEALPFDVESRSVVGERFVLDLKPILAGPERGASFDVSSSGTLVYVPAVVDATATLVWVDREGRETPSGIPPGGYSYPRISPDGTELSVDFFADANRDIYIWDFERQDMTRLTDHPLEDTFGTWSLDGERVYFSSNRNGVFNVFSRVADRAEPAELLFESPVVHYINSRSRDGSRLLVTEEVPLQGGTSFDAVAIRIDERRRDVVLASPNNEVGGELSPDGNWWATQSDELGQTEVLVRSFPDVSQALHRASVDGGRWPLWSEDGSELFYMDFAGNMMAVPVEYEPEFSLGVPTELFPNRGYASAIAGPIAPRGGRRYDISPTDGRFLMPKALESGTSQTIEVVLHWTEELLRRVPAD